MKPIKYSYLIAAYNVLGRGDVAHVVAKIELLDPVLVHGLPTNIGEQWIHHRSVGIDTVN